VVDSTGVLQPSHDREYQWAVSDRPAERGGLAKFPGCVDLAEIAAEASEIYDIRDCSRRCLDELPNLEIISIEPSSIRHRDPAFVPIERDARKLHTSLWAALAL
jgi:hypothetical protein